MPTELYYAPKDDSAPLSTLTEVQQRFAAAGLPCTILAEEGASDMWRLMFEPQSSSTICASTKDDKLVFATLESLCDDDLHSSIRLTTSWKVSASPAAIRINTLRRSA